MFSKIKNIHPLFSILVVSIVFFVLIFFSPSKGVQYGDFGLMYIQVKDIVESGYSTFAVKYKGEDIDPDYKYFPYTKPFIGKVGTKHYIDFPPYFPLINSPFYQALGINGLYVFSFFALIGTLILFIKIGRLYALDFSMIHLCIFLYSFGMTATMYNFVFHEYPIAIFLITLSFYFSSHFHIKKVSHSLIWFGFFGGLSLFFRLEMIFVILAIGISLIFVSPRDILKLSSLSLIGFILPFLSLLYLNSHIHGHPLGLRYVLTLTNESSVGVLGRIDIIRDMLFSSTRGFFFQSSFVLILPLLLLFKRSLWKQEKFLLTLIFVGFLFILLTAPNHGDHRAPRYLFGLYSIIILTLVVCFSNYIKASAFEESNFQKPIVVLFSILVLISFLSTVQNYRWMWKAVANVSNLNEKLLSLTTEDTAIIFRDFAQPLNTQNLYTVRKVFVVEKLENLSELIYKLREQKIGKIVISQIFPFAMPESEREKILTEYIAALSLSKLGDSSFEIGEKNAKGEVLTQWIEIGKNQNLFILNVTFSK